MDLGAEGLRWVGQSLEAGRDFSELVLRETNLDSGRSWADMPDGAAGPISMNFKMSGAPGGTEAQSALFRERAARLLVDGSSLVVEDEVWRPGDRPRPPGEGLRIQLGSSQLFAFLVTTQVSDPATFVKRHSTGYPTNVFLLDLALPSATEDLPRAVAGVAGRVRAIAVAAWDAEGFVWWSAAQR